LEITGGKYYSDQEIFDMCGSLFKVGGVEQLELIRLWVERQDEIPKDTAFTFFNGMLFYLLHILDKLENTPKVANDPRVVLYSI
jgi:hypothetical protein